jgi:hypothetical protein
MKKTFLALTAFVGIALSAHAVPVYSDTFSYADGALVTVSGGSPAGWYTHSGSAGQLQVVGGQAVVGGSNGEDVSHYLTNAAFPTGFVDGPGGGRVYASFTMNMTALPVGSGGTYFFHFRDQATFQFRARTWAATNGAAAGTYRIGVSAAGNSPVYIAQDIPLNETHKVVVRWDQSVTNATLWLDPGCENTSVNTATSADTALPGAFTNYNVCLREGSSSQNAGTMNFDNLLVGTAYSDVATDGGPPSIAGIPDQSIPMNGSTGLIPVAIQSCSYSADLLTLSATSSDTTLVPNSPANIELGGTGPNRTIKVTPATGHQGQAEITVVVTDPGNQKNTNSFIVVVGAPSIAAIPDQTTPVNTATASIPFTVGDPEASDSITVTASSSNPTLVQNTDIVVTPATGNSTSRTVKITPQSNQAGNTIITLVASDGFTSASTSFSLTVYPQLGLVLGDTFSYPDGVVSAVSGGFWAPHSSADSNDCYVVNNQLVVSSTNAMDVHAAWSNSLYFVASGGDVPPQGFAGVILYSKFTVNFAKLPSGSGGDYFAHYKDLGTSNFRARIFALTNGAAPGKFRIGIANGGFTVAAVPQDLSPGTTYTVVSRYNVSTAQSTVWVDPTSNEASIGAAATDNTSPVEIDYYCFRQNSGSPTAGVVFVDDLLIGTSFSDVYTSPLSACTISNIVGNTLTYGGGAGSSFVLLKSATATAPRSGWTRVATNSVTPGTFTVPTGSENSAFYLIKSE